MTGPGAYPAPQYDDGAEEGPVALVPAVRVRRCSLRGQERRKIMDFLTEPRTVKEIAIHVAQQKDWVYKQLSVLRQYELIQRVKPKSYERTERLAPGDEPAWLLNSVRATSEKPASQAVTQSKRTKANKQPVRDAIMAFLSEPRTVREIADHVGRQPNVVTGHLGAMARLKLTVRLDWGVHARVDLLNGAIVPKVICRGTASMATVIAHSKTATSFDDLVDKTGRSRGGLLDVIARIRKSGQVWPDRLVPPKAGCYPRRPRKVVSCPEAGSSQDDLPA